MAFDFGPGVAAVLGGGMVTFGSIVAAWLADWRLTNRERRATALALLQAQKDQFRTSYLAVTQALLEIESVGLAASHYHQGREVPDPVADPYLKDALTKMIEWRIALTQGLIVLGLAFADNDFEVLSHSALTVVRDMERRLANYPIGALNVTLEAGSKLTLHRLQLQQSALRHLEKIDHKMQPFILGRWQRILRRLRKQRPSPPKLPPNPSPGETP